MDELRLPRPAVFWWGVALAVLGAVVLPLYGMVSVFKSDVCSPDSAAFYCSGHGQAVGTWVSLLGGPGVLVAGGIAAGFTRRGSVADEWWPWWVVVLQAVAFVAVSAISGKVS